MAAEIVAGELLRKAGQEVLPEFRIKELDDAFEAGEEIADAVGEFAEKVGEFLGLFVGLLFPQQKKVFTEKEVTVPVPAVWGQQEVILNQAKLDIIDNRIAELRSQLEAGVFIIDVQALAREKANLQDERTQINADLRDTPLGQRQSLLDRKGAIETRIKIINDQTQLAGQEITEDVRRIMRNALNQLFQQRQQVAVFEPVLISEPTTTTKTIIVKDGRRSFLKSSWDAFSMWSSIPVLQMLALAAVSVPIAAGVAATIPAVAPIVVEKLLPTSGEIIEVVGRKL